WEIWLSEAQERMILAVPPEKLDALLELCAIEEVEASIIGTFTADQRLSVSYHGQIVADLDMHFLHEGRPARTLEAVWVKDEMNAEARPTPTQLTLATPTLDRSIPAVAGIILSNGINPLYGKIDPYHMAINAVDEALRNLTAVGGDIERAALLDNFSWGNPPDPAQRCMLVRTPQGYYALDMIYV